MPADRTGRSRRCGKRLRWRLGAGYRSAAARVSAALAGVLLDVDVSDELVEEVEGLRGGIRRDALPSGVVALERSTGPRLFLMRGEIEEARWSGSRP